MNVSWTSYSSQISCQRNCGIEQRPTAVVFSFGIPAFCSTLAGTRFCSIELSSIWFVDILTQSFDSVSRYIFYNVKEIKRNLAQQFLE